MINGLTDKPQLRRDGKIRAGRKNAQGYPENLDHFLLHDAPQLIPILGEAPKEIYFTVVSDKIDFFYRDDLRQYTKNELVCRSMHGFQNPATGANMGQVAAFFKVGQEVSGLRKEQFPGLARAFVRNCAYKTCPDYAQGKCSEHMFLDIMIPQYSMGAMFTLDSSSINAIMNAMSTFHKAYFNYQGLIAGQIYKLFKKKDFINFPTKDGNQTRRETDVVDVANVNFAEYEARFRDKIDPIDWQALMFMRNRQPVNFSPVQQLSAPAAQLEAGDDDMPGDAAPVSQLAKAAEQAQSDAERAKAIGNDPALAKLFAEIALLLGKENTEAARTATAAAHPSVERLGTYLANKIKEIKKLQKNKTPQPAAKPVEQPKAAAPAPVTPPVVEQPPAAAAPGQPTIEGSPLF